MGKTQVKVLLNPRKIEGMTREIAYKALEEITDDLAAMSSQAAPIDKGILHGKYDTVYHQTKDEISSEVIFSVDEGPYNYAAIVHNTHPVGGIGEETRNKPPGVSGITGKSFPAGGMYLSGPLEANRKGYQEYLEEKIKNDLKTRG